MGRRPLSSDTSASSWTSTSGRNQQEQPHGLGLTAILLLVLVSAASFLLGAAAYALACPSFGSSFCSDITLSLPKAESVPCVREGNNERKSQGSEAARPKSLPDDRYCSQTILNELQLWNPHKKVITFSLFDNVRDTTNRRYEAYRKGLEYNVNGAALYYPDWVVRVYVFDLSETQIQEVIQLDPSRVEVVVCHPNSPIGEGGWGARILTRGFAYDDPAVSVMVARDLDSRFSPRELLAVNQWLSSTQKFHSMRDSHQHSNPIMGGMYGMKRNCLNKHNFTGIIAQAVNARGKLLVTNDQAFLKRYVWPIVRNTSMDHDIERDRCIKYGSAVCAEWPLPTTHIKSTPSFYVGEPMRRPIPSGYNCSANCVRNTDR